MERSATLRFWRPWTLRRSSRTPCLTMLFPSFGAIEHVPRECHVVSTCRLTHSSTCLISSLLYFKSSYTPCLLLFNQLTLGLRPFGSSTGIDQEPCWIPAVMLPGRA